MTAGSPLTMHRGTAAFSAAVLLLAGAGVTYVFMRRAPAANSHVTGAPSPSSPTAEPSRSASIAKADALPDVIVPLTEEAVKRAGIVIAPVVTGTSQVDVRLPGVVQPNAYRQVAVTPLVAGRITRVTVELGARVRRGQTLAEIYSPELAEAQTRYVTAQTMLDAHDRELQRTQKLVEIGAASRQELERIHAEHAAQSAAVKSARSQLALLGVAMDTIEALSSGTVTAALSVAAPIDGVITERTANAGLNVDSATKIFTVVDLSTVWVVADVYERDFSHVRVGTGATITTPAYPQFNVKGRVSYIDPQVTAETRTAKVRVDVPNPRGDLRLGMYVDVVITGTSAGATLLISRRAVQHVGDRTVVYVADPAQSARFVEREVGVRAASEDRVEVTSGIHDGDRVVTEGSFFIRAERERLGLRP